MESEGTGRPRLVVVARSQGEIVDLEFVATTRQENIEDQLAFVPDEATVPTVDNLSLRLLRPPRLCYSSPEVLWGWILLRCRLRGIR